MKIKNHLFLFTIAAILLPAFVNAQTTEQPKNEFSISAQIRPRAEYRNGAYRPLEKGEAPAILVHNRTRLTMDYANTDALKLKVSLQNVNIWGQSNQVQVNDPTGYGAFSVFEAYGDVKLAQNFRTKIGRQMISLDDDRLFGTLDWHPAGRSHDALNFNVKGAKSEIQSWFAYNQNYKAVNLGVNNPAGQFFTPNDAQPYQHMQLFYGKFNVAEKSYFSLLVNNLGFRNDAVAGSKVNNMQTFGGNWFGTHDALKTQASAFYQTGKAANGKNKSAYMLSGSVGYQLAQPLGLTLGADYLSGDSSRNTSGETHAFDPLYGTHHKFYGFMDYFYVGNPHSNVGLLDLYFNIAYKASEKTSLGLNSHLFRSAGKIYNTAREEMPKGLGGELDFTFNHQIVPMVGLTGGYSTYLHTASLRAIKNTPDARNWQDWLWLSININPKIFTTKF